MERHSHDGTYLQWLVDVGFLTEDDFAFAEGGRLWHFGTKKSGLVELLFIHLYISARTCRPVLCLSGGAALSIAIGRVAHSTTQLAAFGCSDAHSSSIHDASPPTDPSVREAPNPPRRR